MAVCVTVPGGGAASGVRCPCVDSGAAGTVACVCPPRDATARRATQETAAKTAWVGLESLRHNTNPGEQHPGPHITQRLTDRCFNPASRPSPTRFTALSFTPCCPCL
ncbi:hypothetical protein E2C01_016094 [Portunus trituberculatus]|uniref:Uncharacterized protein n=1 Tax=Portunus trituberculatus TaxID=210409 RepID=A0A5B7DPM2_PORTR|nr:hypothetical protein [Portunus trituberculatus]